MLALITTTAPHRAAARAEAAGAGRLVLSTAISRAAHSAPRHRVLRTPSRSRATARVRGDGLRRACTAWEMDARGPSLRARFVFSVEGPSPCRVASRRVVLTSARPSRAVSRKAHGRASGLRRCGGEVDLHLPAEQAWAISSRITRPAIGKGVGRPAAASIQNNSGLPKDLRALPGHREPAV